MVVIVAARLTCRTSTRPPARYGWVLLPERVALQPRTRIPTIPVLKRILAVLDEQLLIGIERQVPDEEPEREVAPVTELKHMRWAASKAGWRRSSSLAAFATLPRLGCRASVSRSQLGAQPGGHDRW